MPHSREASNNFGITGPAITPYAIGFYHNATFPAMPKSIVAVTTPNALNTLLIVGIVML